jgi:hypothetical protein
MVPDRAIDAKLEEALKTIFKAQRYRFRTG